MKVYVVLVLCLLAALPASLAVAEEPAVDPTRPPQGLMAGADEAVAGDASATHRASWRLDSTLVSDFRRIAVINGQRVTEGERLRGARVERIERHSVLLVADGREILLKEPLSADVKQRKGT